MELPKPTAKIMHIDFNSFFASAEQQANPFLRNKSMGVGRRSYWGSAIIAASYPAKRQGIGLGVRYNQAKKIDPRFELAELDHIKYYDLHNRFIIILRRYSPLVEVYSIDEAFMDMSMSKLELDELEEVGYDIKNSIVDELGEAITCSIGIGNNKLIAKIASNHDKPDGLTIIHWEERQKYLDPMPIENVWGIGRHVTKKMNKRGIYLVRELKALSDSELYSIVGGYYTRLKLLVQGYHFETVQSAIKQKPPKSMQHAHTMEKATNNIKELKSLSRKMSERLAQRLRKHNQKGRIVYLGLVPENLPSYGWDTPGWFGREVKLSQYTSNGYTIYKVCSRILGNIDLEHLNIRRLVVGISRLNTPDLISFDDLQQSKVNKLDLAIDQINQRFGSFTVRSADILNQKAKETELDIDKPEMRFHSF